MFSEFDKNAMARALALAARGLETTDPNPRVGCVIARGERIVGEGWHERAGEAHAEVAALRAAGSQAVAATAYVTLEPCAHQGRTAPCTLAKEPMRNRRAFTEAMNKVQEGMSLSVQGEILRYQRRFNKAWESFAEAERIYPWIQISLQNEPVFRPVRSGRRRETSLPTSLLFTALIPICPFALIPGATTAIISR